MKTTYTVWGTGAAKNSALTNADGADHIAVRIADEHGFDATTGERWAVIVSINAEDEVSVFDTDPAVVGYHELTALELAEVSQ